LRECRLELEDSREKGYLVEVRAVRIDWDYGKRTVLITSLPKEVVGASLVVKAYFDRWPSEELQFKRMKSFACLNRVAGYGKKKLPDEKVRATQQQLQRQITALRQSLKVPLKQIADQEEQVAKAIEKELGIRSRAPVEDGQRKLPEAARRELQVLSREIAASRRQVKVIESQWGKPLRRLRRYEKEWLRLQGKDHLYRIDVELDQIMGFFRMALVNIALWFAKTPAGREINNILAALPSPFCYKSRPCFASSRSAWECWSASFVSGELSFLRISLCVNNSSR